jgi:hypothetical protein
MLASQPDATSVSSLALSFPNPESSRFVQNTVSVLPSKLADMALLAGPSVRFHSHHRA